MDRHLRGDTGASLVYPVISRRSGGLSLGINLFPGHKHCNFNCPYCEVQAFRNNTVFTVDTLEGDLEDFFSSRYPDKWNSFKLKDICISGNGEPSLSPHLDEALDLCARARRRFPRIAGKAKLVLISNATGFLHEETSALIARFAVREGLMVWAKLDAGTQEGFLAMSRSGYKLKDIVEGIAGFASLRPIILQTMVCKLDGRIPDVNDVASYAAVIDTLMSRGAKIEEIHLYTVARPPFELSVEALEEEDLRRFAAQVTGFAVKSPRIRLFDSRGDAGVFKP